MWHLAQRPVDLARLTAEPDLLPRATEEFVRFFTPLTHIGRICTRDDQVAGLTDDRESELRCAGQPRTSTTPHSTTRWRYVSTGRKTRMWALARVTTPALAQPMTVP